MANLPNIYKEIFDSTPIAIIEFDYSSVFSLGEQLQKQTVRNIRQYLREHPTLVKQAFRSVKIIEANTSALDLFGVKTQPALFQEIKKLLTLVALDSLIEQFIDLLEGKDKFEGIIKFKSRHKFYDIHYQGIVPERYKTSYSRVIINYTDITIWQKMIRQLRKQAQLDGLTKLLNHNTIMQRLEEELKRAKRYGLSLSCLMIDFDHFKVINDKFGHQKGDHILKRVADVIQSSMRTVDLVGRYGGDEFLVILPETIPENAKIAAVRIQQIFTSKMLKYQKSLSVPMSVSIGITGFPTNGIKDCKDLIHYADKAMYLSKKAGRNRISLI